MRQLDVDLFDGEFGFREAVRAVLRDESGGRALVISRPA